MPKNAIEVFLAWGAGESACVLATAYLQPGERFIVGEAAGRNALIPSQLLGAPSAEVVRWDGVARVLPPPGARVWVDGQPVLAEPTALRAGEVVDVSFGDFTLRARVVAADGWEPGPARDVGLDEWAGFGLSAFAHFALVAVLAFYLPSRGGTTDLEITRDEILTMRALLDASAEREAQDAPLSSSAKGVDRSARRLSSRDAAPASVPAPTRELRSLAELREPEREGASNRAADASSRAAERDLAQNGGMVALIRALKIPPGEPTPWKDVLASLDGRAAEVNALFGDPTISEIGAAGIVVGSGGGGGGGGEMPGPEIDVIDVGGLGAAADRELASARPGGNCSGTGCPGKAGVAPPGLSGFKIRWLGDIALYGGLDEGAIHRVIEANWGRVRGCYGAGLRRNPALAGRVAIHLEIGAHGDVVAANDHGSTLPDPAVRACIVRAVFALTFAPPHAGTVKVDYPIDLKPEE